MPFEFSKPYKYLWWPEEMVSVSRRSPCRVGAELCPGKQSDFQGSGCNRLEGKKPRFSEHLLFVARGRNGYFTLNHVPTSRLMIECPYDGCGNLRLRSDVIKALTDSRALGITRKDSRGELTTRL